jgi:hypothetical protein
MEVVDTSQINSFAPMAQQSDVKPEESIFVLTSSQLQDIINKAVEAATEPLYREIALDRQRISKLEQVKLQPAQQDRAEVLRALLIANGGKMLAKEARQKMRLGKATFSVLLSSLKEEIETKDYFKDKRQLILILKLV